MLLRCVNLIKFKYLEEHNEKEIFQEICSQVFSSLENNEQLTIYLEGENSQYFVLMIQSCVKVELLKIMQ